MRNHVRDRRGVVHRVKRGDTAWIPASDDPYKYSYRLTLSGGRLVVLRGSCYLVVCGAWVGASRINWNSHAVTCLACLAGGT